MISTKFGMYVKKKKCNSTVRFSKYIVMLIFLMRVITIGYN